MAETKVGLCKVACALIRQKKVDNGLVPQGSLESSFRCFLTKKNHVLDDAP